MMVYILYLLKYNFYFTDFFYKVYLGFLIAACAAANLAIGTLYGEQDT